MKGILDNLLEYKRNWIQHVNRMPRNRLPRVTKHYSPTDRRNHGRPLKRLLDTWDRNGSTNGPTPRQIYDDDERNFELLESLTYIWTVPPLRRLYYLSLCCDIFPAFWSRDVTIHIWCFWIRASLYNSISGPTDATCDRLYFLSMCVLYMFRASGAHHQESPQPYIQPPVSVFVSVCGTVL
jgi:hypothetical protein